MKLDSYFTMLRWEAGIAARIIRVKDLNDHDSISCYDVILIPSEMDGEEGVSYRIDSDIEDIRDRMEHHPNQFAVLGAWSISDLVKGAMYVTDTASDYFESEV